MIPWLAAALSLTQAACPVDGGARYTVALPKATGSRNAAVILHEVEHPADRPVILRVYAEGEGKSCVLLGSFGFEALSPSAAGVRKDETVRVAATTGLARWTAGHPGRDSVHLRIVAIEATGRPAVALAWKVGRVEIVR